MVKGNRFWSTLLCEKKIVIFLISDYKRYKGKIFFYTFGGDLGRIKRKRISGNS